MFMERRNFMKGKFFIGAAVLCCFVLGYVGGAFANTVPTMTKEELNTQLDSPDIVIIDVRVGKDWTASELKIKNAVREDPKNVDAWLNKYAKDKTIILYCA
jgi:predicted sulfurtransferase